MQLLDKKFTTPEVAENVHPLCTSTTRRAGTGTAKKRNIKTSGRNKIQTARAKPEPVAADEDEIYSDSTTPENMERERQPISTKRTTSTSQLYGEESVMVKAAIQEEEFNLCVIELAILRAKLRRMKEAYMLELGIPFERLPGICRGDLQVARVGDEPLASTQYVVDEWV